MIRVGLSALMVTACCGVAAAQAPGSLNPNMQRHSAATRGQEPAKGQPAAKGPLGVWRTEKDEGLVRVEACGPNLCGFTVDRSSGRRGQSVLVNMRQTGGNLWTGIINDVRSGQQYDSKVSLASPDQLRVEGCVLGGMFCGGETWTRVSVMAQSN